MLNYIFADIYRIFSRKDIYIFFSAAFVFTLAFNFFTGDGFGEDLAFGVFNLMNWVLGTYLFAVIYNGDLTAKTLPSIIGFGNRRTAIVLSKIIIGLIVTTLTYFAATVILFLLDSAFSEVGVGFGPISTDGLIHALQLLAFFKVAALVVYGTQKPGLSIVVFLLLILGVFDQIIMGLLGGFAENIDDFMIGSIVSRLVDEPGAGSIVAYLGVLTVFSLLSVLAFWKKELEF